MPDADIEVLSVVNPLQGNVKFGLPLAERGPGARGADWASLRGPLLLHLLITKMAHVISEFRNIGQNRSVRHFHLHTSLRESCFIRLACVALAFWLCLFCSAELLHAQNSL